MNNTTSFVAQNITVVGTGYVGLVSGACFAEVGHNVVCVDVDPKKIEALRNGVMPIHEPGLDILVSKNVNEGRLSFTTNLDEGLKGASFAFIAVGTPSRRGDGHADLSFVDAAIMSIARSAPDGLTVVTKSTVPIGTNAHLEELLESHSPEKNLKVASNPEFLREGEAITDFMNPDRVVVGANNPATARAVADLYAPLNPVVVLTDLPSAETVKYAANAFLAVKIAFTNELAALCERTGGDVLAVAHGMGLDARIGARFLQPGPGYGGSCFPKDTRALARTGQEKFSPMTLVEAAIEANDRHKRSVVDRVIDGFDNKIAGKKILVLGVTFKAGTDDMRDAPSLSIIPTLIGNGADITVVDPYGRKEGEFLLPGVLWSEDIYHAAKDADAVLVLTEWPDFKNIDLKRLRKAMRGALVFDMRNMWDTESVEAAGLVHRPNGRPGSSI